MKKALTLIAAIPIMVSSASAINVGVDEIIFQNGAGLDSSQLSPSVSMSFNASVLTITLQNLSADTAGDGALVLFTGLAFDLPTGVTVNNSVPSSVGAVTAIGPSTLGWNSTSAQGAWGWDNNSAGLSGGALAYATLSGYDTRVSTVASDGKNAFDGTGNAGGMDYGVFSAAESSVSPSPWVKDTLEITLNLNTSGYTGTDLIGDIGNVAAIFGSPNGTPSVPDGGATLALLGVGILGISAVRRRFVK